MTRRRMGLSIYDARPFARPHDAWLEGPAGTTSAAGVRIKRSTGRLLGGLLGLCGGVSEAGRRQFADESAQLG